MLNDRHYNKFDVPKNQICLFFIACSSDIFWSQFHQPLDTKGMAECRMQFRKALILLHQNFCSYFKATDFASTASNAVVKFLFCSKCSAVMRKMLINLTPGGF